MHTVMLVHGEAQFHISSLLETCESAAEQAKKQFNSRSDTMLNVDPFAACSAFAV